MFLFFWQFKPWRSYKGCSYKRKKCVIRLITVQFCWSFDCGWGWQNFKKCIWIVHATVSYNGYVDVSAIGNVLRKLPIFTAISMKFILNEFYSQLSGVQQIFFKISKNMRLKQVEGFVSRNLIYPNSNHSKEIANWALNTHTLVFNISI